MDNSLNEAVKDDSNISQQWTKPVSPKSYEASLSMEDKLTILVQSVANINVKLDKLDDLKIETQLPAMNESLQKLDYIETLEANVDSLTGHVLDLQC